ncbi:MAG: DUF4190 domain-containing protein [Aureliella sp.]
MSNNDSSGLPPDQPNANPYAATANVQLQPGAPAPHGSPASDGDGTGGVIPYKNPHALIAYYLGIFSLFPILGIFLSIPALVLGIIGLKKKKANPIIKGSVHAWIGIVCGTFFTLIWGAVITLMIVGLVFGT